jgi:hypothetical protein
MNIREELASKLNGHEAIMLLAVCEDCIVEKFKQHIDGLTIYDWSMTDLTEEWLECMK